MLLNSEKTTDRVIAILNEAAHIGTAGIHDTSEAIRLLGRRPKIIT